MKLVIIDSPMCNFKPTEHKRRYFEGHWWSEQHWISLCGRKTWRLLSLVYYLLHCSPETSEELLHV